MLIPAVIATRKLCKVYKKEPTTTTLLKTDQSTSYSSFPPASDDDTLSSSLQSSEGLSHAFPLTLRRGSNPGHELEIGSTSGTVALARRLDTRIRKLHLTFSDGQRFASRVARGLCSTDFVAPRQEV